MATRVDVHLEFELKNLEELLDKIERLDAEAVEAVEEFLKEEAEGIIEESQKQVPVDTGTLKSSAYVQNPETQGDTMKIRFGYGGPNDKLNPKYKRMVSEYAVPVHERMDVHHVVGKAKYLEDPFNEAVKTMEERVAKKVRSRLGWK